MFKLKEQNLRKRTKSNRGKQPADNDLKVMVKNDASLKVEKQQMNRMKPSTKRAYKKVSREVIREQKNLLEGLNTREKDRSFSWKTKQQNSIRAAN